MTVCDQLRGCGVSMGVWGRLWQYGVGYGGVGSVMAVWGQLWLCRVSMGMWGQLWGYGVSYGCMGGAVVVGDGFEAVGWIQGGSEGWWHLWGCSGVGFCSVGWDWGHRRLRWVYGEEAGPVVGGLVSAWGGAGLDPGAWGHI